MTKKQMIKGFKAWKEAVDKDRAAFEREWGAKRQEADYGEACVAFLEKFAAA